MAASSSFSASGGRSARTGAALQGMSHSLARYHPSITHSSTRTTSYTIHLQAELPPRRRRHARASTNTSMPRRPGNDDLGRALARLRDNRFLLLLLGRPGCVVSDSALSEVTTKTYSSRCLAISVSSSARRENSRSAVRRLPRSSKFFSLTE